MEAACPRPRTAAAAIKAGKTGGARQRAKAGTAAKQAAVAAAAAPTTTSPKLERTYRCTLQGSDGYGGPTPDGFLMLAGAHGPHRSMPKLPEAHRQFRQQLIDSGILQVVGREVVLAHDQLFPTSTLAAIALTGETCDGGMEWKTEDERTLFAMTRHRGRDDR